MKSKTDWDVDFNFDLDGSTYLFIICIGEKNSKQNLHTNSYSSKHIYNFILGLAENSSQLFVNLIWAKRIEIVDT